VTPHTYRLSCGFPFLIEGRSRTLRLDSVS
jgi:hypothetical protein